MEAELGEEKWQFIDGCQREWDTLPPPGPRLIVGLDGSFIHARTRSPAARAGSRSSRARACQSKALRRLFLSFLARGRFSLPSVAQQVLLFAKAFGVL